MYRTLLVALDGSPLAERSLPLATAISRGSGARLVVLRAAEGLRGSGAGRAHGEAEGEAAEALGYLRGVAARLAERGVAARIAAPRGEPVERLLDAIATHEADLVVLSTHGRSGLGRWVYGSVAEGILHRSPVPVLLVPATAPVSWRTVRQERCRLLVPLDGSQQAEAALPHALAIARALAAGLVLLHVIEPRHDYGPDLGLDAQGEGSVPSTLEAEAYLATVAASFDGHELRVRRAVRAGLVAEAILEEARADAASLVVMTTHGRTGLGRLPFGSVTTEVLHRCHLPLLLVRPHAGGHGALSLLTPIEARHRPPRVPGEAGAPRPWDALALARCAAPACPAEEAGGPRNPVLSLRKRLRGVEAW